MCVRVYIYVCVCVCVKYLCIYTIFICSKRNCLQIVCLLQYIGEASDHSIEFGLYMRTLLKWSTPSKPPMI